MVGKLHLSSIAPIFYILTAFLPFTTVNALPPDSSSRGEEYFLIRTLETLYSQWPINATTPEEFAAATVEIRREAIRLKVRSEMASCHPSITEGYSDFVAQLDAFTSFLAEMGIIQETANKQATQDNFNAGLGAGQVAGQTQVFLAQNGAVGAEAVIVSLIAGVATFAVDSIEKSNQRDDAVRTAMSGEIQQLEDSLTETLERTRQRFSNLARIRGWAEGEIGWNLTRADTAALETSYTDGGLASLILQFSIRREALPFDPYVASWHNHLLALQHLNNPAFLDQLSEDCYSIRLLIPEDQVYSKYRIAMLEQAADLASCAKKGRAQKWAPSLFQVGLRLGMLRLRWAVLR